MIWLCLCAKNFVILLFWTLKNGSILLYVPKKYYAPIVTRLAKLEFIEVFKQKRRKYIVTCLQQLIDDVDTEIILEEEDDEEEDGLF